MESARFDEITARLAAPLSRRRSMGLLGLLGLRVFVAGDDTEARRKKKKKNKNKKCKPSCDRKICGDDGCGGTCGACGPCQECQGGLCVNRANGATCGSECQVCQSGQCVARAEGAACGTDSCKTCQSGQCTAKLDGTACPEHSPGECRTGICRAWPECVTFGNQTPCQQGRNCCYQNPDDACPVTQNGFCPLIKAPAGHRCRFDTDCQSNACLGYQCG